MEYTGVAWEPVGETLGGGSAGDLAGASVALSAGGYVVAVGAPVGAAAAAPNAVGHGVVVKKVA